MLIFIFDYWYKHREISTANLSRIQRNFQEMLMNLREWASNSITLQQNFKEKTSIMRKIW